MLGSSCSPCCGCKNLNGIESIEITLSAVDAVLQGTHTDFSGSQSFTRYVPGSSYSGTYSLSKISDTADYQDWRYTFDGSGQTCADDYVQFRVDFVTLSNPIVRIMTSLGRYENGTATATPKSKTAFACTESTYTGYPSYNRRYKFGPPSLPETGYSDLILCENFFPGQVNFPVAFYIAGANFSYYTQNKVTTGFNFLYDEDDTSWYRMFVLCTNISVTYL